MGQQPDLKNLQFEPVLLLSPVHRRPKDDTKPTPHQNQKAKTYCRLFAHDEGVGALRAHLSGDKGPDDSSLKLTTLSSDDASNAKLDTSCWLTNPRTVHQVFEAYDMSTWRREPVLPVYPVLLSARVMLPWEMLLSQMPRALDRGADAVFRFPDTTVLRTQQPIAVTVSLEQDPQL